MIFVYFHAYPLYILYISLNVKTLTIRITRRYTVSPRIIVAQFIRSPGTRGAKIDKLSNAAQGGGCIRPSFSSSFVKAVVTKK